MSGKFYVVLLLYLLLFSGHVNAQSYGLGFAGQEVMQDKRTGLDLSAKRSFCFARDFELSFDLAFIPGYNDYFGYIFRLVDADKRNIDLVYDKRLITDKHFKLIIGDREAVAFDIDINRLYKNWHRITLFFDQANQELRITTGGKSYHCSLSLRKNCYKILFGVSNYQQFRATDVPPMKIRQIRITENGHAVYRWPLAASEGTMAKEEIRGANAQAVNPIWLKRQHWEWQHARVLQVSGYASVALNPNAEELYIVGEDSLVTYNVPLRKIQYLANQSGKQHLLLGNQSLYDTENNRLLNVYLDQRLVSVYDFNRQLWSRSYTGPDTVTNYWHQNKFYHAADSSLYLLGGYGHFVYHKKAYRYHFPTQEWESMDPEGNYVPRYLAALGQTSEGIYLLGGYGSITGQQILNPKNIYELDFYDVYRNQMTKILNLKPKAEDFAFANSMVIDEKTRTYYALTFPNHRYNSHLQMIRGSLDTAEYTEVGNLIPYAFHDIQSFADLFYCPSSKMFAAVTILYDVQKRRSLVHIYTLSAPLEALTDNVSDGSDSHFISYIGVGLVSLLVLALIIYRLYTSVNAKKSPSALAGSILPTEMVDKQAGKKEKEAALEETPKNSIFLFGDLQLFDAEGQDITKLLTPLIKELFLLILIYTLRLERGISTEKLTETLWFDKSAESARNNRSVNIAKLKSILEKMEGCKLSKQTGYWKINLDETKLYVDFQQYLKIVKHEKHLVKADILALGNLTQRGGFLVNVEYNWLDMFKSEISNEIIDTYLHFASSAENAEDYETLINIANNIFHFDTVNEEAMVIKCKALVHLGKHSLAKTTFENFNKDYAAIYGQEFDKTFQQILL